MSLELVHSGTSQLGVVLDTKCILPGVPLATNENVLCLTASELRLKPSPTGMAHDWFEVSPGAIRVRSDTKPSWHRAGVALIGSGVELAAATGGLTWDLQPRLAPSRAVVAESPEGALSARGTDLLMMVPPRSMARARPEVKVHPSAGAHITDKMRSLLGKLVPFLAMEAWRNYVVAPEVEISGFVDPEEGAVEVVVAQWVCLPAPSAMEYWDRLVVALEPWVQRLPDDLRRIATERLAIEVRWE